jgi:biopolymer transport protein ExbB
MEKFDLNAMLMQGWPVLSLLLIMSVLSVTVLVERQWALWDARLDAKRFITAIIRILREDSAVAAIRYCRSHRQPVAKVAAAVISKPGGREGRERVLRHAVQSQIRELEAGVPVLGTIASSAPFVGLFGTVIGIIRAFSDIASNAGGGPEVVANGIAEALVTTAGGLLVAVPALIGYNYLIRRIQRLTEEIDLAVFDLIEWLDETPGGTP